MRWESESVKDNSKVLVLNNSNHGVFWRILTFSRQRVKETSANENENIWFIRKKKIKRLKCPTSQKQKELFGGGSGQEGETLMCDKMTTGK